MSAYIRGHSEWTATETICEFTVLRTKFNGMTVRKRIKAVQNSLKCESKLLRKNKTLCWQSQQIWKKPSNRDSRNKEHRHLR